jgi:hypothetical protein
MNTPGLNLNIQSGGPGHLLYVDAAGVRHENVRPVRLFPLTDPSHWITLCSTQGADLACVEDVDALPEDVRRTLLEALAGRDFVPVIQSIQKIRHAAHGHTWFVTTDRGRTTFSVENDESIQPMGGGRLVVIDQRNTRYLIPNPALLDAKSRQRLERYS